MPPRIALVFKTRLEENVSILNGIAKFNRLHGKWSSFVDDQAIAQKDPNWLLNQTKWDGIITKHATPEFLDECLKKSIPCVDLSDDDTRVPGIPKIRPDNAAIGHIGAEHFIEKGFKYFGFCSFSKESWSDQRKKGYYEALEMIGAECHCFENEYPQISTPQWEKDQEQAIGDWIKTLPKPIAIMACNDLRALQVINACRGNGIEIPNEVSVLGANNESIRCELSLPQLSSIPINGEYYGQKAAKTITDLMRGMKPKLAIEYVEPLDVITRRSSDFLTMDDSHVLEALKLINEQACSGLTVNEIAKEIHVSRSLLERRFRKHLGHSPQVEIRKVQIQRIKALLQETGDTLVNIADQVGFKHPEYMSVVFKKCTHMTPNQYRMKRKGNV